MDQTSTKYEQNTFSHTYNSYDVHFENFFYIFYFSISIVFFFTFFVFLDYFFLTFFTIFQLFFKFLNLEFHQKLCMSILSACNYLARHKHCLCLLSDYSCKQNYFSCQHISTSLVCFSGDVQITTGFRSFLTLTLKLKKTK